MLSPTTAQVLSWHWEGGFVGQHPVPQGFPPRADGALSAQSPCHCPAPRAKPGSSLADGCLTQPVTLGQWHQWPRAGAAAGHSSLLPLRDTGIAHHRSLQCPARPHTAQLSTWSPGSAGSLRGHRPQAAWGLSGSTNLPGTIPWINQHAHAIVVKHLFVQVIEATMFTARDLTTGDMEHDLGLQLLPPDFSS